LPGTAFVRSRLADISAKFCMLTGTVEKFKKNNRFVSSVWNLAGQIVKI
jgi:hypothetical protein